MYFHASSACLTVYTKKYVLISAAIYRQLGLVENNVPHLQLS